MGKHEPFVTITADELVFGYDDTLVELAHKFYPKGKKPTGKMGLLLGVSRNRARFASGRSLQWRLGFDFRGTGP